MSLARPDLNNLGVHCSASRIQSMLYKASWPHVPAPPTTVRRMRFPHTRFAAAAFLSACSILASVRAAQEGEASQAGAAVATGDTKAFQYQHVPVEKVAEAESLRIDDSSMRFDSVVITTISPVVVSPL